MKELTKNELDEILENHKHWIYEDCNGWEDMKADLSDANLSDADLSDANLKYANLKYANLSDANLSNANLSDANLKYANLSDANLSDADLKYADLSDANLSNANLKYAKNIPFIPYTCPDTGSFIGYKKANGYIVELEILSDAKRCSATGRKCRCNKAKVLSIQNIDGTISDLKYIPSGYDSSFVYKVGEIVEEPNFCENRWRECAPGIHFFINRQEAVEF